MRILGLIITLFVAGYCKGVIDLTSANGKIERFAICRDGRSLFLGINYFDKRGAFIGKSEVWKMSLNNLDIVWKSSLKTRITEIVPDRLGFYVGVNCYRGETLENQILFLGDSGDIKDSLQQKRGVFLDDSGTFLFTDDYLITGGTYSTRIDKNLYSLKIGPQTLAKYDFKDITYDMAVPSRRLILMAIRNSKPPALHLFLAPRDSVSKLRDISLLCRFRLEGEQADKIIDDSTVLAGSIVYRIINDTVASTPIFEQGLPGLEDSCGLFLAYELGYLYYKDIKLNKMCRTTFDEQFDDPSIVFKKLGRNSESIVLNRSFFIHMPESICTGIIKDRFRKLFLKKIQNN